MEQIPYLHLTEDSLKSLFEGRESQYQLASRVTNILLQGDLARLRAETVASDLGMSPTTLRRRLRLDNTHYQLLLDLVRKVRCDSLLEEQWLPGKCVADALGYQEVNSFYRAFRRWTGITYSEYRAYH